MSNQTVKREFWNGPPELLREAFTLTRVSGARASIAIWSHPLGWELRLNVNGHLVRSQVTREPGEIDTITAEWHNAMTAQDWRAPDQE